MKIYELTYIISPEIGQEQAEVFAKEIESSIQSKEGAILKSEMPSAKTLTYRIKKQASGFFVILEFQMPETAVKELIQKLEKDTKILRHMLVVKLVAKARKERRTRKPVAAFAQAETPVINIIKEEKSAEPVEEKKEKEKDKVELSDIEKKLDEILGE